jgi:adenylate cyclase
VQLGASDTGNRRVPGVLLHAQALRNMLGGELIQRVPSWAMALLAATAALLLLAPWWAAIVAIAGAFFLSAGMLAQGWFLPPASLAAAALVPLATDLLSKLAERRRLRASFKGYVSPGVMQEILAGRIQPGLAGVRRYVCVMFADIRGYTTRAQAMKPEEVIGFLNRYFERVVALVHGRGGTVVSIMGDGVMTVFGSPKPLDNPCQAAFDTAREMLAVAAELEIEIGIGLNAGEALCGHVGSRERHEYSAIGDVTNVASRLQSLTKEHGYRILAARAVAESLAERSELARLGMAPVKGHAPVELFGYSRSAA